MHRYDAVPNQNFPPHLFPFPCACTLILPSFRLDGWTEFFSGREGNALSSCACWILVRPSRRVCHVMCGSGRSARRERDDARQSEGCIILDGHRTGKVTWAYGMCARGAVSAGFGPFPQCMRYSSPSCNPAFGGQPAAGNERPHPDVHCGGNGW